MYAEERQLHIEALLASDGRVAVVELASALDVSTETVRRDLDQLEARGALRRVHGGAVAANRISRAEESVAQRRDRNASAKERIAAAGMKLVPANFTGTIAIDSGTTTGMFAERLARWQPEREKQTCAVITNSIHIAAIVAENPHLEIHTVGGRLRGITGSAVGAGTLAELGRLRPDVAFIGANGVHGEFGLSTPDPDEAAVKTMLTRGARRAVALVDETKLGVETLVSFARLDDLDTIVSDVHPDAALATALEIAGVEVVIA